MNPLTDIQYLKGVGPARAKYYGKLGIHTILDLLYHFPRGYLDLSRPAAVSEAVPGETAVLRLTIEQKQRPVRLSGGRMLCRLTASDETGSILVTFFNARYTFESLSPRKEYLFHGKINADGQLVAPMVYPVEETAPFLPIYHLTAGLSAKTVQRDVRRAFDSCHWDLRDPLPGSVREPLSLPDLPDALYGIHFPEDPESAERFRERFIFEELFTLALAMKQIRQEGESVPGILMDPKGLGGFYQSLPFEPTGAQRRCVEDIAADLGSGRAMNRLLQGDVGSGKTMVAAAACRIAVENGVQCAVMAPTGILAEQHYRTFTAFLPDIPAVLLTGSLGARARREALEQIASGEARLVIGTHALISESVEFERLGLVVTDEQHRFGVHQRAQLRDKTRGEDPHVLVMSATPIPRTLALMIYGDLDLSILDELPPGRQTVETMGISYRKLPRAWGFVRELLDQGFRAYAVCPKVEDEEASGPVSAEKMAKELQESEFAGYSVGLLHGKLKNIEKDATMRKFKDGDIQLLVCTTVVEVGVDVPEATAMVILDADRFGLSQLHQLRGRVGRGSEKSYCILVSNARGETSRERLATMCETNDGFKIAEKDLALRGPGDFFGGRQHGLPDMRIADMASDMAMLSHAQEAASALLATDPSLELPEHAALRERCRQLADSVGSRPD